MTVLAFNLAGFALLYALSRLQRMAPDLAFNAAVSFAASTNLQACLGQRSRHAFTRPG
jgi:potassium-transporting ATPase potassium-binding subunit